MTADLSLSLPNGLDLSRPELQALLARLGEPRFRADQIFQWLWQRGARSFEDMSNVSKALRAKLAEALVIRWPGIEDKKISRDGTVKFLLRLDDGQTVETVLIPEKDHLTLCLSSQVGCAMGCRFCSTGRIGFKRNMTVAEILGQVLVARAHLFETLGPDFTTWETRPEGNLRNLVFMGMGEPLLNLDRLLTALAMLNDPLGLDFAGRRMTVSTVGLPDKLRVLGTSGLASLAVSLHAPTQELRAAIMPAAAQAAPLPELMAALDAYPLKPRQRVTYEYVLLKGVNDSPAEARELVRLLGQRKAKVNLIAYNPGPGDPFQATDSAAALAFEKILWDRGLAATLRKSKGQDINAACGQLRAAHEGM